MLGRREEGIRRVVEFVFYDDLDPDCLRNGIVELDGRRLGELWSHCRERRLDVVADVHVHPGTYYQSLSDQANPMIAETGHLAVIVPHFALGKTLPGGIGIFEYAGNRRWIDRSRAGSGFFCVGWWPA